MENEHWYRKKLINQGDIYYEYCILVYISTVCSCLRLKSLKCCQNLTCYTFQRSWHRAQNLAVKWKKKLKEHLLIVISMICFDCFLFSSTFQTICNMLRKLKYLNSENVGFFILMLNRKLKISKTCRKILARNMVSISFSWLHSFSFPSYKEHGLKLHAELLSLSARAGSGQTQDYPASVCVCVCVCLS